jgi:class 3 adenylate cyclase/tetratricopeptide (TPR) repeat protein
LPETALTSADSRDERRLVTVLFADISGFTAMSEDMDPEDVREIADRCAAVNSEHVRRHGGTVVNVMGDAVMAVFGAPTAHGDDPERAVRAGLAMVESVAALSGPQRLELHVGINTGEVMAGMVGPEERRDYTVMGDTTNTASRLMSAAARGEVRVGRETYLASRRVIRYEEHEPVQAKGKQEALQSWRAVDLVAAAPDLASPFVGRNKELDRLNALWEMIISENRSHLVTVIGAPGIGKSRLSSEFADIIRRKGGRAVQGRCLPYGEQTGYQAFSGLVREIAGIFVTDTPDISREKLNRAVAELYPDAEAPDAARYLSILIGLSGGSDVVDVLFLFFAARRFVERLGLTQPTLVVFEDIHWAHPSELELLEYLNAHVRDSAVLLVSLARPEFADLHPAWGGGQVAQTTIPLEPLLGAEATKLASHLLQELVDEVVPVERLVEIADGNPLFLEELAASVLEGRDADELPVTVKATISARIDATPPEARAALLCAAVIGRTFWRGALREIGGVQDLDAALDLLETRDLVRRDPLSLIAGDAQLTFKHILIREVAYATVSRSTRRKWHAAVARHLEQTAEGSTETLAGILAYHWQEAAEPSRAVPYLLQAAEVAQRGWAKGAAVDLYAKALELTEDQALRRQIRLKYGMALVALEEFQHAAEELESLLPELEGKDRLEALLAQGRATHWSEKDAETIAIGEKALEFAKELDDREAIPAAMALLSQGLQMRGAEGDMDQAKTLADRALETWVPNSRRVDHAEALYLAHDLTYWTGAYERAVELSAAARALATDVRGPELLLRGGGGEAVALAALGRHEEALRKWDELFEIARQLGRNTRVLLNYSALAFREMWDLKEARRRTEEALERSSGMKFSMPRSFARTDLILTDLLEGDVGRAQAQWPGMWADAEHSTAWTTWLIYGRLAAARAEIALRAESPDVAIEWANRTLEITVRSRRRKYEAVGRTILGEALGRTGRPGEALRELNAAVAITDDLIGPPARWNARAALGRTALALGKDDIAERAYREAGGLIQGFSNTLAPERSARLLAAPAIQEILRLSGVGEAKTGA